MEPGQPGGDAASKVRGGVDRKHGTSTSERRTFYALHAASIGLCAWVVFFGGAVTVARWLGHDMTASVSLRAVLMFGAAGLYFVRHGVTLYYLLARKITWSEAIGLGTFMIIQEVGLCLLAAGVAGPRAPIGPLDGVAIALLVFGSYLNTGSEVQRKWWKAHPENKGKCYTAGLFAHSMHINYFGDSVMTTGWVMLSMTWWTFALPLVMTILFVFVHIPPLDAYLAERYGEPFEVYAARTRKLIPFVY